MFPARLRRAVPQRPAGSAQFLACDRRDEGTGVRRWTYRSEKSAKSCRRSRCRGFLTCSAYRSDDAARVLSQLVGEQADAMPPAGRVSPRLIYGTLYLMYFIAHISAHLY
jgi:hypothetical protein